MTLREKNTFFFSFGLYKISVFFQILLTDFINNLKKEANNVNSSAAV